MEACEDMNAWSKEEGLRYEYKVFKFVNFIRPYVEV